MPATPLATSEALLPEVEYPAQPQPPPAPDLRLVSAPPAPAEPADPLAVLDALSEEEKIALFS